MAEGPSQALRRWSRRKRLQANATSVAQHASAVEQSVDPASQANVAAKHRQEDSNILEALPDPATLTRDSDFTPFLRAGVPDALHRAALRALWRSDPVLANLDGLVDYGEDMRAVGTVPVAVATAYRIGSGYAEAVAPVTSQPPPFGHESAPLSGHSTQRRAALAPGPDEQMARTTAIEVAPNDSDQDISQSSHLQHQPVITVDENDSQQ